MAGFMGKFKNMLKQPSEEMDYDDYYSEEEGQAAPQPQPQQSEPVVEDIEPDTDMHDDGSDNLINMHDSSKVQFVLFKPETFDKDITALADEFIKRNTVILNMEHTNKDVGKRIIDFLSGVAYANHGKIKRVATNTYIIIPSNVDLTGDDLLDELENSGVYF